MVMISVPDPPIYPTNDAERKKAFSAQLAYCHDRSREDGWIHCSDCVKFGYCWMRIEFCHDTLEYCEFFAHIKDAPIVTSCN